MKKLFLLLILSFFTPIFPTQAASAPSVKSAHGITESYFQSYSKKFKSSFIGRSKLTQVEINQVVSVASRKALVDAILGFQDGSMARVLVTIKRTPPLGWSVDSWETLGRQ